MASNGNVTHGSDEEDSGGDQLGHYCDLYYVYSQSLLDGPMWKAWLQFIVSFVLTTFGLAANVISFVIMTFTKMRRHSYTVYLSALSLVDVGNVAQRLVVWLNLASLWFGGPQIVKPVNLATSIVATYCSITLAVQSSWLVSAISIERLIVVCFPVIGYRLCTRKAAIIITVSTLLAAAVVMTYILMPSFELEFHPIMGCYVGRKSQVTNTLISATFISILPITLIIACNASIIIALLRRKNLSESTNADPSERRKRASALKVTKLLVALTTTLVICLTPATIVLICMFLWPDFLWIRENLYGPVINILWELNYGMNFVIYVFTSAEVRGYLACRGGSKHNTSSSQVFNYTS
ncbi:uncharacterized protein LOC141913343 [Tubulanus polymorphus]|uniref:uncharacterized protein LOC141913343 n=1 Tax=Tubulanus polymorphus TaxID=672921 RepID=UPI003DA673D5